MGVGGGGGVVKRGLFHIGDEIQSRFVKTTVMSSVTLSTILLERTQRLLYLSRHFDVLPLPLLNTEH